jgi:hypothetical protein
MMHATARNPFGGCNETEQLETTRANMHPAGCVTGCDQMGRPKTTRAIMMHAAGSNLLFVQLGITCETMHAAATSGSNFAKRAQEVHVAANTKQNKYFLSRSIQ